LYRYLSKLNVYERVRLEVRRLASIQQRVTVATKLSRTTVIFDSFVSSLRSRQRGRDSFVHKGRDSFVSRGRDSFVSRSRDSFVINWKEVVRRGLVGSSILSALSSLHFR